MILDISTLIFVHVLISFLAIVAGLFVLYGLLRSDSMPGATGFFLAATAATLLTGFLFPISVLTPALATGIIAAIALIPAIAALYLFHLRGTWRGIYVIGSVVALYLNMFVLVVQAFLKIPSLNALAPNGSEPPFLVAQAVVLLAFIWAGILAYRRFRPVPGMAALA